MKTRLVALSLLFAALGVGTAATAAPERAAAAAPAATASERPVAVLAQAGRDTTVARRTVITAAGSVLVLADGAVVQARFAQILPPAPGFVYER